MIGSAQMKTLPNRLHARIEEAPRKMWTPTDFVDFGSCAAVDKALQRMDTTAQLAGFIAVFITSLPRMR